MKYLFRLMCAVLIVAGVTSCSDFLDVAPDNRTEIDNLEKVKALLTSAYPDRCFAASLEPRCDGVIDHGSTIYGQMSSGYIFNYTGFRWDEYPSMMSSDDTDSYWMACYDAIASANHALEAIESLGTPKESLPYLAEAKLCRAYAHFTLLTMFSRFFDEDNRSVNLGIPYVTESETVTNKKYDRGTVASTLEKVKNDLDEGLKYVGNSAAYSQPKFHFTKDAAYMLAMRIALFEGDYNTVIAYANKLIPEVTKLASIYTMDDDGNDVAYTNEDGSERKIPHYQDAAFVFCNNTLFNWSNAFDTATSMYGVAINFSNANNPNIILAAVPYSTIGRIYPSNGDLRYCHDGSVFKKIITENASGVSWKLPAFSYGSMGMPTSPLIIPKFYEDFKTSGVNSTSGTIHSRVSLFRIEEAILSRIEAYAMIGEYDKAINDLTCYGFNRLDLDPSKYENPYQVILDYYYSRDKIVSYYQSDISYVDHFINNSYNSDRFTTDAGEYEGQLQRGLVLAALDNRRMEFLYEGMRWFDVLRWNIPVTHKMKNGSMSTLTLDDDRRVIQLPETSALSGLQKNPYENIPQPWN